MSFIERLNALRPLFRVSFNRGSTVLCNALTDSSLGLIVSYVFPSFASLNSPLINSWLGNFNSLLLMCRVH